MSIPVRAQSSQGEQFAKALTSIEGGKFREAYQSLEKLRSNQPENIQYAYYTGLCLVEMNRDLEDAIEFLYPAAARKDPPEAVFQLGRAHHMNYNFSEALRYYELYEGMAGRQQLKESRVRYWISVCREAMRITSTYNQYKVMTVAFLDLKDSLQYTQIKMKGGWLQTKPAQYFDQDEDRNSYNSLMFMPQRPLRGEYAFFSGMNRNGKNGLQIFRIRKGVGNKWSEPEELKALGSEGDEILPYFDPVTSDLYYASDGKGGIGGFDLYRTHYDEVRDQWSEPLNLGFPVNSVRDEVLFLPGTDLGMVMFFSTRAGTDSSMAVYRVHMVEPKKKADPNDFRLLAEIASLEGAAENILAEMESFSSGRDVYAEEASPEDPFPESTEYSILEEPSTRIEPAAKMPAHQLILADALAYQASSDSLRDLANAARLKVRKSEDPNDRWVWQKQIMVWEKKAADRQMMADELFRKLRVEREVSDRAAAVNVPETIEVDTVVEDLTVYRFKEVKGPVEGEPGVQPAPVPASVSVSEGGEELINRFDVLEASPYSASRPIPLDVDLPGGVFYRIQIGVFGQPVDPAHFSGISPVTGEVLAQRGLYKYYAGKFSRYQDASDALPLLRARGYGDAFIVAWYNGDTISTQRAKHLE